MNKYRHARYKFKEAIKVMATYPKSRNVRLGVVMSDTLQGVSSNHLPADLRPRYEEFRSEMASGVPTSQNTGRIAATVWAMHPTKAKRLSKLLFDIFDELHSPEYD